MATNRAEAPERRPVWLDCDPGHDDACAIILAGYSPRLRLLGISTVAGNTCVENTTTNAAKVLIAAGLTDAEVTPERKKRKIHVSQGQAVPLLRPMSPGDKEVHGDCGLAGVESLLPTDADVASCSGLITKEKGVLAMAKEILDYAPAEGSDEDARVTVLATGVLTNVALLLQLFPEVKPKLREIVFMGGAIGIGNRGPVQEWNILCDPEAAQIVVDSGVKTVMVPLEVTHTALVTPQLFKRIEAACGGGGPRSGDAKFAKLIVGLLSFFKDTYAKVFGFANGPPLHDPCAAAWIIDQGLFESELMRVDVECGSSLTAGQTVCDVWHYSKRPKNVHVCRKMDVDGFWKLMLAAFEEAGKRTPMR